MEKAGQKRLYDAKEASRQAMRQVLVGWGDTSLPESIGSLTNLQELYLNNNQLTNLPEPFGNLTNLQKLWLSDNKLTKAEKERIKQLLPNCEIKFKR